MIRVLLISFLAMLAMSCAGKKITKLPKDAVVLKDEVLVNSYFAKIGEEHVFRAHINLFKHELSGLLVVKRINDSLHRVVLTSDFGNTLFDFSIYKDSHKVNYAMKDLDRKFILNILALDFSRLVATELEVSSVAEVANDVVYKGDFRKKAILVKIDKTTSEVKQLYRASKRRLKIAYTYELDANNILSIEHYNFPLTIKLTPIEKLTK